ncbi:hypothetical protein OGAPHI_002256 [Ogataea philodendri]|uniref:Protein-serine/threonine kinase n=1 Tax=Ogataea philodendri TaxID=1378263 RepID=A0A9P8PBY9_9ASCO|nr:uncharacterized protein OGAPHI_002256 [Ogataea philodendri]KAH3668502.1 hypothetical protein OGAPHI_002256 [Ogataea philodendri]
MSLFLRNCRKRWILPKRPLVRFNSRHFIHEKPDSNLQNQHQLRTALERFIKKEASRPLPTVSLDDLLRFSFVASHKDKPLMLIENANDTLSDMFVLVTKRLSEFMKLPYIVVLNPKIAEIYNSYLETLKVLLDFVAECDPECEIADDELNFKIQNLDQNDKFLEVLKQTIDIHTDNLSILSEGFEEISGLTMINDTTFLNEHLQERILMRLLANHHIQLSEQLKNVGGEFEGLDHIGIIEPNLNVLEILERSFGFVNDMASLKYDEKIRMDVRTVTINSDESATEYNIENFETAQGHPVLRFPYISAHIEYVLNEILKNSTRAHIENEVRVPIETLIVVNKPDVTKEGPQFYHLEIRISDQGLGIDPEVEKKLFDYSFTTFDSESVDGDSYKTLNHTGGNQANIIAGMGYGLPLSLTYNRLFHGDIQLKTVHGFGTTVYLKWIGVDAKKLV